MKSQLSFFSSKIAAGCRGVLIVATAGCLLSASPVWAQDAYDAANPAAAPQAAEISQEVLDGLLAPIALYPDALLAQVLMAATYPMDVIEAARWQRDNSNLSGQALQDALAAFDWDPSVKSLATVPQVLQYMNDEPRWMQDLGQAVIADQPRVMASVQVLRQRASAYGSLTSNDKQVVSYDTDPNSQTQYITIAPASPQVVYVPVYDPRVVYGTWWWPSLPVYWGPPYGMTFTSGFYWGVGFYPSVALWGGFNWGFGMITINAPLYRSYYRVPPPMMGPRGSWRRPSPVYSAPVGGHYRRPPYSPHVVRPSAPRPNYGTAPGYNTPRQANNVRPGTAPGAGRPHNNAAPGNTQGNARPAVAPNGGQQHQGGYGNATGGGSRQSGGQSPSPSGGNSGNSGSGPQWSGGGGGGGGGNYGGGGGGGNYGGGGGGGGGHGGGGGGRGR